MTYKQTLNKLVDLEQGLFEVVTYGPVAMDEKAVKHLRGLIHAANYLLSIRCNVEEEVSV